MIVHIVQNKQLKKPIKARAPSSYVMIDANGIVCRAMDIAINSSLIVGSPVATFDMKSSSYSVEDLSETFDLLRKECRNRFTMAQVNRIFEAIFPSQSLTIAFIVQQLIVSRTEAKALLEICTRYGAYRKYYTYWVKNPAFETWLLQKR